MVHKEHNIKAIYYISPKTNVKRLITLYKEQKSLGPLEAVINNMTTISLIISLFFCKQNAVKHRKIEGANFHFN